MAIGDRLRFLFRLNSRKALRSYAEDASKIDFNTNAPLPITPELNVLNTAGLGRPNPIELKSLGHEGPLGKVRLQFPRAHL